MILSPSVATASAPGLSTSTVHITPFRNTRSAGYAQAGAAVNADSAIKAVAIARNFIFFLLQRISGFARQPAVNPDKIHIVRYFVGPNK